MKPITGQHSGERWRADPPGPIAGPTTDVLLLLIRGYKLLVSPLFAGSCRFLPSCSDYMREAILRHGALRGLWLGLCRLLRCHPFCAAGHDPVPARFGAFAGLKRSLASQDLEVR